MFKFQGNDLRFLSGFKSWFSHQKGPIAATQPGSGTVIACRAGTPASPSPLPGRPVLFSTFFQGRHGPIIAQSYGTTCIPIGPLVPGYFPWSLRGQSPSSNALRHTGKYFMWLPGSAEKTMAAHSAGSKCNRVVTGCSVFL
jgi:hypothetical protein